MENKYKHMDYIQSAISRMASNSFYLKGWNVTIIAAIVALSFKESDWRIYACALALNIVFWVLDAYYLKQEKLFRELYNKVSKISDDNLVDFSMNTSEYDAVNESSSLQIKYEVDKILRSFISLSKYDLISCAKEWRANNKSFQSALDYIYLSKDIIIKQDVLIS